MKSIFLTIPVIILLACCSDTVVSKYDDGTIQSVYKKCNEPDCLDTMWYYFENGVVSRKVTSEDNVYQGVDSCYHDNGTVERTCFYVDGKKDGLETVFEIDGRIKSKEVFKHDTVSLRVLYHNGIPSDMVFAFVKNVGGANIVFDSLVSAPILTDSIVATYIDSFLLK